MNLNEAYEMVREDMDMYNLTGWKLVWMDRKTAAGTCRTLYWSERTLLTRGVISLSRPFFEVFDVANAKETGLHEIAHALDKPNNRAHGPEWKKIARRIGSTGERCVPVDAPKPNSRYHGTCPQGHEYRRHKKTDAMVYSQFYCPPCHKKSGLTATIQWVDMSTGRTVNYVAEMSKVSIMTPPKTPTVARVAPKAPVAKAPLTWKQKFDQGMTSFGDDW